MDVNRDFEPFRRELIAYSYRMLGSAFEAEDAVQETFFRAWKAHEDFRGDAKVRSWLYRIATNVCLDMLRHAQRRALPTDLGPASSARELPDAPLPEQTWLTPIPDSMIRDSNPVEWATMRESVQLAFVAALHHLPPSQRAVLILREVLQWPASDVGHLLDITPAAVNSVLQRARATIAKINPQPSDAYQPMDKQQKEFLDKYLDAFQRYDLDSLTSLMHDDVVLSMPPLSMWITGFADVREWFAGHGKGCEGSRLILVDSANGMPAIAQYRRAETAQEMSFARRYTVPDDAGWLPWALQVLELRDHMLSGVTFFLDTPALFEKYGLPKYLD